MAERVTQKIVDKLKKISGNVRGAVILEDVKFLERHGGKEAIRKLNQHIKELGIDVSFEDLKPMQFYPEYLSVLVVLFNAEILDLDQVGVFKMGQEALKHSFFMKLFINYFVSIKRTFKEAPKYWQKHFDFAEIEAVEFNEKEKYIIFRVKGYKFHPIMCTYHAGYFLKLAQMALGSKEVTIEEDKCMFRGDPYHEFILRWQHE